MTSNTFFSTSSRRRPGPRKSISLLDSGSCAPEGIRRSDSISSRSARLVFHLITLLFAFTLTACSRGKEPIHQEQILVFGTLVDITVWGVDDDKAQQATAAVIHTLNELHHRWHAWEPGPLTDINARLARGETVTLAPDQVEVIRGAQILSKESGYLFNPAIGNLIALWGFHADDRPSTIPPPSPAQIQKLVTQHPTLDDLHFDGNKLSSVNPALQMDFGAYVKSYGVDRAIDELRKHGVNNAIVNAGGDLRAIGRKGDKPWRIGIRDPRSPGILASIEIQGDESVFTSGDYERFFIYQGKRYHHIIDPRNGYPPDGAMSATVIYTGNALGGGVGGGASTALMVAGPKDWLTVVRGMHLKQAMLVAADRTVYVTPDLAARLHFEVDPPPTVIIGQP
jgi:thiamine biosynthesis lipoprotein